MVTFLILMVIRHVFRMKLRLSDAELEIGDVAVHGEEAYPSDELVSVSATSMADEAPKPACRRTGRSPSGPAWPRRTTAERSALRAAVA